MGDWRTVNIEGTCNSIEAIELQQHLDCSRGNYDNFGPLSNAGSICGLNNWPDAQIHAVGNLAERDYGVEDIEDHLKELVEIAPSLNIKVHCGGDYESKDCVATITVKNGEVTRGGPEIETLKEVGTGQMQGAFLSAMMRR